MIDVGLGAVTSLCNFFTPEEVPLDWLLFTRCYPDHSLGLNRLCETLRRSSRARGEKFNRISAWCRNGTGQWLQKNYSYEWYRYLSPRQTFLIHLSGHEAGKDAGGWGWRDEKWEEEAQQVWQAEALPGSVHIPSIEEEFPM